MKQFFSVIGPVIICHVLKILTSVVCLVTLGFYKPDWDHLYANYLIDSALNDLFNTFK